VASTRSEQLEKRVQDPQRGPRDGAAEASTAGREADGAPAGVVAANSEALERWVGSVTFAPESRAAVLVEVARTAAKALDHDARPCPDCQKRGTPAFPATLAEYRRTLDELAAVLAEGAVDDDETAKILRLAGR
jgi:hypothetical protein